MSYYLLRPCKGKAAFEAIPKINIVVDIKDSIDKLIMKGYDVLDAGVMLVAKKEDLEVTIFPSGKLLVKTSSREKALEETNVIYDTLGLLNPI